jgi:ketoreductase RED2
MSQSPVVLVTGSSSGIGAAIARAFAAEGKSVVVNSSRSREAGEALAREIGGVYERADIAEPGSAAALVERSVGRFGHLDILVNCAATTDVIPHDDLDAAGPDVWRRILDVNVIGTWAMISAAVPHLRASGGGQIINITSTSGTRPAGSSIPYAVSKAAVNHMTILLAKSLGPAIRVNAVAPGLVDTPWTSDWREAREYVTKTVALRRPGTPEDIAAACIGIANASYMTGAVVPVDGGLSLL